MLKLSLIVSISVCAPWACAVLMRCGVAGAGDREVQVAWEGEEVGLLLLGVDPQHHDRVGAIAPCVAEEAAGVGVVRVDALAAVGADEEVVGRVTRLSAVEGDVARPGRSGRSGCRGTPATDAVPTQTITTTQPVSDQQPLRPRARARAEAMGGRHGRTTLSARPGLTHSHARALLSACQTHWRMRRWGVRRAVAAGVAAVVLDAPGWRSSPARPAPPPARTSSARPSPRTSPSATRASRSPRRCTTPEPAAGTTSTRGCSITTASVIKAQVLGAVLLKAQDAGRGLTAWERSQIGPMIRYSFNPETSNLYAHVGSEAACTPATRASVSRPRPTPRRSGSRSSTAVDRTNVALRLLYGGGGLRQGGREEAWAYMTDVHPLQEWGISAGVPAGWTVAQKNGFYPSSGIGWRVGSSGFVRQDGGDQGYAITVMTEGATNQRTGHPTGRGGRPRGAAALTVGPG